MRLLFALGEAYLPQSIGGGTLCTHHMVLHLLRNGHSCEVVCGLHHGIGQLGHRILRRVSRRMWGSIQDHKNGYVTNRGIDFASVLQLLRSRLVAFRPDVVITQGFGSSWLSAEALKSGYPTIARLDTAERVADLHDFIKNNDEARELFESPKVVLAPDSQFIARRVRELLNFESSVINEVIGFDDVKVSERKPEFITFINPSKVKGLDIAIRVAALLPHRKFLFVESWALNRAGLRQLKLQLKGVPNVQFRPRSLNMNDVYQRTSVLLMPSQWEEAFGRVIVEAGLNGIPAVASRIGGIPEALGDGGVLLSPNAPAESWAAALERIMMNHDLYVRLSENAVLSAARPELDPDKIIRHLLEISQSLLH